MWVVKFVAWNTKVPRGESRIGFGANAMEPMYACDSTLKGHTECVLSVAFNHDGTKIASGSDDKSVKVWNVSTGECISTLKGHTDCMASKTRTDGVGWPSMVTMKTMHPRALKC